MLRVRPMQPEDVPLIVDYFCRGAPDFYPRLGIDPKKVPPPEEYAKYLTSLIDRPSQDTSSFYLVWLVYGEAVGHSGLKDIVYGKSGSQHLHIWKPLVRGQGHGPVLFSLSVLEFLERFQLQSLICEPRASNPAPNRMLQKIGFEYLGSRIAASSEISEVCELNTYRIERKVAEAFLKSRGRVP